MQVEFFVLPARWASFLINGDASGLTDDDVAEIESMYDETEKAGYLKFNVLSCSEEAYFTRCPDFIERGMCEVLEYVVQTA